MDEDWINNLLDDVEDPIVSDSGSFGYLGFMESLINSSINNDDDKERLIDSLETMRKSEMDALMIHLKDNQIHRDCREQYKEMCNKGVFK